MRSVVKLPHSVNELVARLPRWRHQSAGVGASEWLEIRCSLFPHPTERRHVAWSALGEALDRWRAERRFRSCFFVRKPPGLRLRFAGDDLPGRLEPVLLPWLVESERRNDLRGFRVTLYEPETARFGGAVGMAIAHEAFDDDSRDAICFETLFLDDRQRLPRSLFSVAACSDLFRRTLEDRAEIWDVWQRLRRALPTPQRDLSGCVVPRPELQAVVLGSDPVPNSLSEQTRSLLEQRFRDNQRTASAIVAARDAGRLHVGVREWLTACTVFHWNRLGLVLAPDDLAVVVSEVCRTLDPNA